jgi:hypothetical protein
MITHYDMRTGEVIGDTVPNRQAHPASHPADTPELRLMTVREDIAVRRRGAPPPADIAQLPVQYLLGKLF